MLTCAIALSCQSVAADPARRIVEEAMASVGIRYAWARADERATDCAGLVRRVASLAGIDLPRTSSSQYRFGVEIGRSDLLPGDLVFFRGTYRRGISHVGIYIGEGRFVHAASRRRRVVIDQLDQPYYVSRFAGARRITLTVP